MKMKKIFILGLSVFACLGLGACKSNSNNSQENNQQQVEDYGTLTIADITVKVGKRAEIETVFSNPKKQETLTYTFEGKNIHISEDNQYVVGDVAGTETVVTAKSEHFETTFKVTVPQDYGTLKIADVRTYLKYNGRAPKLEFSKPEFAEELTYTIADPTIVKYENGLFVPLSVGSTEVQATSEHFSAKFKVYAANYDYENRVSAYETAWAQTEYKGQTVFAGDSFFDKQFWGTFYNDFAKKDVLQQGISATTVTDWRLFSERIVYPQAPKNLVLHVGTNDMFDDGLSNTALLDNLKAYFEEIHTVIPETKVYWFTIEPRTYALAGKQNKAQKDYIDVVNNGIMEFAEGKDYLTVLDSASKFYNADGIVQNSMFKDGTHPQNELYLSIYKKMLLDAGLVLDEGRNLTRDIKNITRTIGDSVGSSPTVEYYGASLTKNFSLKGTIKMEAATTEAPNVGNNPHIEFRFTEGMDHRFLLWDAANAGKFISRWAYNGYPNPTSTRHSWAYKDGLEITFEVVATEKDAFLYINNTLETVFGNFTWETFHLGSEKINLQFINMSAVTKEDDPTEWAKVEERAEVKKYTALTAAKAYCDYE
jgi:lysophospholipase L1-like esterase